VEPKESQKPPMPVSDIGPVMVDSLSMELLSPIQIEIHRDIIVEAVREEVPGFRGNEPAIVGLLEAVRNGAMQCWGLFTEATERRKLVGFGLTELYTERWTDRRICLIFHLHAYDFISTGAWKAAYMELERFAKQNGCDQIHAFTRNSRVIELATILGWDSDQRVLVRNLK